jgi:anti-sigma-K factor RskA
VRARDAQIENLLQSATMQQIELRAVDPGAGKASARALYSPQGGLLVVAAALPKLDHEKCYQLWLIRKGAPAIVSAGLLQTSDDGRGFLFAQPTGDLAQLTGLAITDEPKGGSVSARGHKLLFGAQ